MPINKKEPIKISRKIKKDIVYPIFVECSEIETDDFWKKLFSEFAIGKCPFNICIDSSNIVIRKKKSKTRPTYWYNNNKDITILTKEIKEFIKSNTDFLSKTDKKKKINITRESIQRLFTKNWFKKKTIRDFLFFKFALEQKKKYNLKFETTLDLYKLIHNSVSFKHINASSCTIEKGEITDIDGIVYNSKKKKFESEYDDIEDDTMSDMHYLQIYQIWDKYIKGMQRMRDNMC